MNPIFTALGIILGLSLLVFLIRLLFKPIRWLFKLLLHAVIGWLSLGLFNFLGLFFGIGIPVTWLNAILVGILGLPGVILLLLIQWLL